MTNTSKDRSTLRLVACGAALLPLLLAVGCAGSDTKDTVQHPAATSSKVDAAFLARAEKVCASYARYNATHFFTVQDFNRFDARAAALPRVGAFLARNPSYRTLLPDLENLNRPDTGEAAWHTVLGDIGINQTVMKQEIRGAHQRDVAAFAKYDARLTTNTAKLSIDLTKLGLPGGSSCYGMQGDPLATAPRSE